jgi:hypothetical protein
VIDCTPAGARGRRDQARAYLNGQDHAQAVKLLAAVDLEDTSLAGKLRRILASKDSVHYSALGFGHGC